jgi:rhodanese-related sulfurtransferase
VKQTTNILYWSLMLVMGIYFAYTKGWILANFDSISPSQAKILLEEENNITLLDVRTIQEYKEGHLRDATLIPLSELADNLKKLSNRKEQKIIVYCRSGNRSISASRILVKNGFTPLNVKQGIIGLMGAGVEIIK